ncbi:MAG: imidazole glycerol phosphate synthase, glutamine amidotransferase subunit [Candidatus Magasanikbacteria bacterium RIFOXYD2_FULL_41_14]|uniref:Imidazole glycerol phosphate synthase subunit HisH n=1 Tax=Candidatus Magasanikbacteria bacterium RIFOXYD2_FULL_41_14 TaxID=1798709 RepID=A0A1F6PEU8_9BACT|nr:MAG: imidazole glycerol phosphate synthase, glutamine amidotransferase subunit [Candidatus Magasanikbacteria bacterium RIFOXYD2_FULL_41_14]
MIVIIDYKSGNVGSLQNAILGLGYDCEISSDPGKIKKANKIIFPGQGRAKSARRELKKSGIDKIIKSTRVPFLGICLGMQLLADFSAEDNVSCLSVIPGNVFKLPAGLKVPQIGWNRVRFSRSSPLLTGINNNEFFYFAHSYYFQASAQYVLATTDYGVEFPAVISRDNFYSVQFHPEKSGLAGLKLLNNFCAI